MPYRWTPDHTATLPDTPPAGTPLPGTPLPGTCPPDGAPVLRLDLWPHRSLPARGFAVVIWIMFGGALLPLIPFIGSIAFWVLLLFMMTALAALWIALRRSDRDRLREELLIWPDRLALTHWTEKGEALTWRANPYWVRLTLHPKSGQIENYLTLAGGDQDAPREVQLGTFLSPEERKSLHDDLARVLSRFRDVR